MSVHVHCLGGGEEVAVILIVRRVEVALGLQDPTPQRPHPVIPQAVVVMKAEAVDVHGLPRTGLGSARRTSQGGRMWG